MRSVLVLVAVLAVGWFAAIDSRAVDKKEEAIKGTIVCAKCGLKEAKKCITAIQVKEGEKVVTYYLDDRGTAESYHEAVCGGEKKEGTVKGIVSVKDNKKWIKPSKVEFATK